MTCPFCGSTDIADLAKGGRCCLDCDKDWVPGSQRKLDRQIASMDWFDRLMSEG